MLSKHTHISRKTLAIIFSLILLSSVASSVVTYVVAQSSLTITTFSGGIYPGASSYTIFTDSGVDYAKNSHGAIDYSSTDASTVIQYCIDALSSIGGTVYVTPGRYHLSTGITLQTNVNLIGDYGTGAFKEITNSNATVLTATSAITTMITSSSTWTGRLENLYIDGNYLVTTGLNITSPQGASFKNLEIRHMNSMAFYIGVTTTTAALNTFENVFISDTTGTGMKMVGTNTYPVTLNTFITCRWSALTTSLDLSTYVDTNTFLGGRVEAYHGFGIALGNGGTGVYNNDFYNVPVDGEADDAFGIYLASSSEAPNSFYSGVFGGSLAAEIASTKVEYHNTYGITGGRFYNWNNYVTEFSNITSISNGGLIPIGLVASPNNIQLTSGEEICLFSFASYDKDAIVINIRYLNGTIPIGSHSVSILTSYQPKG